MQVSCAAEPGGSDASTADGSDGGPELGSGPLRNELRTNLAVAGFSLGLSVAVAVGLSLLMTLLG